MSSHRLLKVLKLVLTLTILVAQSPPAVNAKSLVLATANTGGTYYPVGVAVSSLLSAKLAKSSNLVVTAINTAGSGENVRLLEEGECDLALLSGLYAVQAYRGMGVYQGHAMKNMAAISMLWNNVEHYVIRNEYVKKGDFSDLKNLSGKFSIGKRDSGTIGSAQVIFDALGIIKGQDFDAEYLGYNPAVEAIINKKIAGAALTAGLPVAAVAQLFATAGDRVTLLNVTDEQLKKINNKYELWHRYIIKAGTYRGQNSDVETMAYQNILVASNRLTESEVYTITKCLFENLPQLADIHKATGAITLENALEGILLPIHPGAARYYREAGVNVPEYP